MDKESEEIGSDQLSISPIPHPQPIMQLGQDFRCEKKAQNIQLGEMNLGGSAGMSDGRRLQLLYSQDLTRSRFTFPNSSYLHYDPAAFELVEGLRFMWSHPANVPVIRGGGRSTTSSWDPRPTPAA